MNDRPTVSAAYDARRERLRPQIGVHADALLASSAANVRYLTGFTGSNGRVLVTAGGNDDVLFTDARYTLRAEAEAAGITIDVTGELGEAIRRRDVTTLALEAAHVSWQAARDLQQRLADVGVELVACDGLVESLRSTKDVSELTALRRACDITSAGMKWLIEQVLRPGVTERELARALETRFVELGAQGPAFPTIVAAGPNGASPHHDTGDAVVERNDLVTIDAGARVDGYNADCTRTVGVGVPTTELRTIHDIVLRAQQSGRRAARVGVQAQQVDAAARQVIVAAGRGEQFVHPTGHGVGLEVHEAPRIAPGEAASLVAGSVFTVEPGVYVPGVGGVRIEDTLVVDDDGTRILTDLPRDLIVV